MLDSSARFTITLWWSEPNVYQLLPLILPWSHWMCPDNWFRIISHQLTLFILTNNTNLRNLILMIPKYTWKFYVLTIYHKLPERHPYASANISQHASSTRFNWQTCYLMSMSPEQSACLWVCGVLGAVFRDAFVHHELGTIYSAIQLDCTQRCYDFRHVCCIFSSRSFISADSNTQFFGRPPGSIIFDEKCTLGARSVRWNGA